MFMTGHTQDGGHRRCTAILGGVSAILLMIAACGMPADGEGGVSIEPGEGIADFVEPGFPFIVATVDARGLGSGFAANNVATRGVVLFLGDDVYAAFDPDLLRMAVGWHGDSLELVTMAQISYQEPNNKANQIPKVLGHPVFANGLYAGWQHASSAFRDPRPPAPNPNDPGRGPLPAEHGRWNGIYVNGDDAVLSYTVHGTAILEQPSALTNGDEVGIARTFRIEDSAQPLTLVVAEAGQAGSTGTEGHIARVEQPGDSVLLAGVVDAPADAELQIIDDRYVTLRLPADLSDANFRVVVWRGPAGRDTVFDAMLDAPVEMARHDRGGPRYWNGTVETIGVVSPDTAAYVVDRLTLPLDNQWRRNVRVVDVSFFPDGERAAIVTFEGDVWLVGGIDSGLERLEWQRYASGLYEPMGIEVVDNEIYVHSRQGIVRLEDIDDDGEADFYETFSDLPIQSIESREFPLGFAAKPGGGFYLSRGGALDMGPQTAAAIMPGFRAGSPHSGSILEVSADGRRLEHYATGLREPFIGVHPTLGIVSASDQQGNFVPATPVYIAARGGYHGVPATAHRDDVPAETPPVVWIPHEVDPSGSGHVWVTDERMFGGDALIHLSYGRPGAFRVFVDSTAGGTQQGAVVPLLDDFAAPLLNGAVGPRDGNLYVTGFQIWGTRATELSIFARVRRTAEPSPLPVAVHAGMQGVVLRFDHPLDATSATDVASYDVQRWNYQRTEEYGSGHFMLDGSPGQERLAVAAAHLSSDRQSLLLVIPGMREVMQMQVGYTLAGADGDPIDGAAYLTVHAVDALDLASEGFAAVDWRADLEGALEVIAGEEPPSSAERGEDLYRRIGCVACHSTDGTTEGKLGPTFRGLYGSTRAFTDGTTLVVDEEYLRRAILEPSSQIVEGYDEGMPAYLGVLDDAELESLIEYIRSLR